MKVLGTWNRVRRVQWKYPFVADFPRSLPISQSPCYSREFFTPYESTRDVKSRPTEYNESTLWLPIFHDRCRFLSLPVIVGNFSPLMKVLGTWNRVQWVQWKYPFVADFPRSLPISQSPCYSREFFTPYESTRDVKSRTNEYNENTLSLPIFHDRCRFLSLPVIVGHFSPLMKVLGTWNRVRMSTMRNTLWLPIFHDRCRFLSLPL